MLDAIPETHLDLVDCPRVAVLTTLSPSGYPQTSVVWCDFDGQYVRVNTMRGFAKERNMRRDPRVTLLCFDPGVSTRYLEIRGLVTRMSELGAREHLNTLASRYEGKPVDYFGDVIDRRFESSETPVLCLIKPLEVVAFDCMVDGASS